MLDLLLILAIVVLVFGSTKLRTIGSDLGAAVKGFKRGLAGRSAERDRSTARPERPDAEFPEVTAARKRSERDDA
ncbi:MAG TPA: twin-arginine translocase TatA/TatE family subunit [Steroidobacteraceae bacterium]|nr:twin-arginine translocase TatA/TatE family subunit [Steroidobacteraceae bacterium]